MDKRELAYAKQSVLATRDWDVFQAILRRVTRTVARKGAGGPRRGASGN